MRRFGPIALALVFAAAGCTGRDGVRDAGESVRGLVRVDLSYTHAAGRRRQSTSRFDAQARFVRYRAFDAASVPTILGFADFDGVPLDGCKVSDGTAELDSALAADAVAPTAEVALLDAGSLELRGPVDRAAITPRHYPELVPFVSGVVYGGDELRPVALGARPAVPGRRRRRQRGRPVRRDGDVAAQLPDAATSTRCIAAPISTCAGRPTRADQRGAGPRGALVLARRHAHGPLPRPRRRRLLAFRTTPSPSCRRRTRCRRQR